MFTVLRIELADVSRGYFLTIAEAINKAVPGACKGPDRDPLRMSCEVSDVRPWDKHLEDVVNRLDSMIPVLNQYLDVLTDKQLDILIEPEDWGNAAFDEYPIGEKFLRILVENKIDLVLTVSHP